MIRLRPAPAGSGRTRGRDGAPAARTERPAALAVPGLDRPLHVKLAAEPDEFRQALSLVAEKYQARGYEEPGAKAYRFTPFHALPDTATFVVKEGPRVVATMSLVPDTALLGLPLDCIYGAEVAALRRAGRHLGEVTSLADRDLAPREFLQAFMVMNRLMFQYHLREGGDAWVITVHPRHRNYYVRVLGFEPLGPRRSCPSVCDHPAEAFLVDVAKMRRNAPRMHERMFGEPVPAGVLAPAPRPEGHVAYFAGRSTQAERSELLAVARRAALPEGVPRWRVPARPVPGDWFADRASAAARFGLGQGRRRVRPARAAGWLAAGAAAGCGG
jgi:hypothetical protein